MTKKQIKIANTIFIIIGLAIIIFLYLAPKETTPLLPKDEIHLDFYPLKKKEAEKFCGACHDTDKTAPLPTDHPPKHRCLFCHKRK